MASVVVRLPEGLRGSLKSPFGPVYTEADALLGEVSGRLITVGDVVTYHVVRAGRVPGVSVVDERTERSPVDPAVKAVLGEADVVVENPAATLTEELLRALVRAMRADGPVRIRVEGEEDLVALPAIAGAPSGASVVYGQPGEGMVHVRVAAEVRERACSIIRRMDGDPDRVLEMLADSDA